MNSSEKLNEIAPALVAAQQALKNPRTDSKATVPTKSGGKYQYEYLSLPALSDFVRTAFKNVGLAFTQEVTHAPDGIGVTTRILHLSGQWLETGPLYLPVQGGPQDFGGAITYGRRYALAAAVGIAPDEDDDAGRSQETTKRGAAVDSAPTPAAPSTAGSGEGVVGSPDGTPPSAGNGAYSRKPENCPHENAEPASRAGFKQCPDCGKAGPARWFEPEGAKA